MIARDPYKQYQHDSVYTATPAELTLMLYNGAIKFIMQGEQYIIDKDYQSANNSIIRAQDIISELSQTLDMKYEISNNFKMLYDYILSRLVDANLKKEAEPLSEAILLITEFRDTWQQAMKIAKIQEARAARG
ncbi:MAG: flagellar export chaperone FliS [Deltaproteobacteria bacterium]